MDYLIQLCLVYWRTHLRRLLILLRVIRYVFFKIIYCGDVCGLLLDYWYLLTFGWKPVQAVANGRKCKLSYQFILSSNRSNYLQLFWLEDGEALIRPLKPSWLIRRYWYTFDLDLLMIVTVSYLIIYADIFSYVLNTFIRLLFTDSMERGLQDLYRLVAEERGGLMHQ